MQIQKVNNQQSFKMALRKPNRMCTEHISSIFSGDVDAAKKFAELYANVKANQKFNKYYDIVFDKNYVTGKKLGEADKFVLSVDVVNKKTKGYAVRYEADANEIGKLFNPSLSKNKIIAALRSASESATQKAEAIKSAEATDNAVQDILNKAYSSKA